MFGLVARVVHRAHAQMHTRPGQVTASCFLRKLAKKVNCKVRATEIATGSQSRMRFFILLVSLGLLHILHAAVIDESQSWTLRDTEDDDESEEVASGAKSQSESAWIAYSRSGGLHAATVDEVETLEQYLRTRPDIFSAGPKARLESYSGEQMEDGPNKVDLVNRVNPRPAAERDENLPMASTVLDVVPSTNFYPEYAVGLLENGCTAFLVGPQHAITAAHCVYNSSESSFADQLDMWRGRNDNVFLGHMSWSAVIISHEYFVSAAEQHDWALIIYTKPSRSPVWLKMGFSESIYNVPYTMFGYLSSQEFGVMHSTVCRSHAQVSSQDQLLSVQCGSDECFEGGPLMRGYNFQRSKMPIVYGIAHSSCDSYTFSHNNVIFQPDLFWSLCYFMSLHGFDAQCAMKGS